MTVEQKPAENVGKEDQDKGTESLSGKFLAVLPERERQLVLILANGEYNKTRAMIKAGYARSTAYKQQTRVIERPRVQQALLALEFEQKGPDWLNNDELRMIGVNVRSVRQLERRKQEAEVKARASLLIAQAFRRRR